MPPYLVIYLAIASSSCAYTVNSAIGINSYSYEASDGDSICINISIYPLTILFLAHGTSDLYTEYQSQIYNDSNVTTFSSLIRYLPPFRHITSFPTSITLDIPTACNVSFILSSLPGMCANGTYFSNVLDDYEILTTSSSNFFQLSASQDKCLFFANDGSGNLSVTFSSSVAEDRLILYTDFTSYQSILPNTSLVSISNSSYVLRILTGSTSTAFDVSAEFILTGSSAYDHRSAIYTPSELTEECSENLWYSSGLDIALIVITVALFIGVVVLFSIRCGKTRAKPSVELPRPSTMSMNRGRHVSDLLPGQRPVRYVHSLRFRNDEAVQSLDVAEVRF